MQCTAELACISLQGHWKIISTFQQILSIAPPYSPHYCVEFDWHFLIFICTKRYSSSKKKYWKQMWRSVSTYVTNSHLSLSHCRNLNFALFNKLQQVPSRDAAPRRRCGSAHRWIFLANKQAGAYYIHIGNEWGWWKLNNGKRDYTRIMERGRGYKKAQKFCGRLMWMLPRRSK